MSSSTLALTKPFEAHPVTGPDPVAGWTVTAVLPRNGTRAA